MVKLGSVCVHGNPNDREDNGSHFIPREVILQCPSYNDNTNLKPPGCRKPALLTEQMCFKIPHGAPDPGKVAVN